MDQIKWNILLNNERDDSNACVHYYESNISDIFRWVTSLKYEMSKVHHPLTPDNCEMTSMDQEIKNKHCKVVLTYIQWFYWKSFRKQCRKITMCHFMIACHKWKWLDGRCRVRVCVCISLSQCVNQTHNYATNWSRKNGLSSGMERHKNKQNSRAANVWILFSSECW